MGPAIEILNDLAETWSGSILRAAWQGGLAIAAAWFLVRCRPGLPPRVACWAWRLADLKLIIALLWATPLLLPLLPPRARPGSFPEMITARDRSPSSADGSGPIVSPDGEPAAIPEFHRPSPASVLLCSWLSGVMGAAILAGRGWIIAVRMRRSCRPVDRADVRDAATELARVLGLQSVPALRTGPAVHRPMLVGALRPAILLPAAMLRDPRSLAAIRPVLAHELAHVRRGDLLWSGLAGLVRGLFFFHPLVWLAHREALVAREVACDALALRASGVRPSEYGRILLDIAAGGPERSPRWTATLGMAGPAGSLKRRLMAMKTTQQLSRRRLVSWAIALLAVGAAGIIPWQLGPRAALAQDRPPAPPAKDAASDGGDRRAPATQGEPRLRLAEAGLELAEAQRQVAEALVKQAEARAAAAASVREYRRKQLIRITQLAERGAVERRLVDEEEDRSRVAQDEERAAKAQIIVSRASLEAARAALREADAIRDIAIAESVIDRAADAGNDLKKARALLRAARLDQARADRTAARAEIDRAEANLKTAQATVLYRTKQVERFKQLVDQKAIEQRLVDEQEQALTGARDAEREAEAAIGLGRARLKVAEARLKAALAGAGAVEHSPRTSPPIAPF